MKREVVFLFFISFLLFSCGRAKFYTVKNNFDKHFNVGTKRIDPGACVQFLYSPVGGDFPLKFTDSNSKPLSEGSYLKGHYEITPEGKVIDAKECHPALANDKEDEGNPETQESVSCPEGFIKTERSQEVVLCIEKCEKGEGCEET